MNYEKAYKEAIERAKVEQETFIKGGNISGKSAIETIFPELRESEDERIKKEIIDFIQKREIVCSNGDSFLPYKKWIAWLEKQELKKIEQKPAEWSEEDERHRQWILECLVDDKRKVREYSEQYQSAFDWLYSLKPNHWKPSDEQMEAIKYFIDFHRPQANASTEGWSEFKNLESLYKDLKNL